MPAGAVVRTEPAAGSKARPGVEVKLVVSNGEARAVSRHRYRHQARWSRPDPAPPALRVWGPWSAAGLADTEGNRQKNEKPSPAGSRAAETDSEGIYIFDDLQVYVQKDASGRLVDYNTPGALDEVHQTRYTVHMAELNGGYAASVR